MARRHLINSVDCADCGAEQSNKSRAPATETLNMTLLASFALDPMQRSEQLQNSYYRGTLYAF